VCRDCRATQDYSARRPQGAVTAQASRDAIPSGPEYALSEDLSPLLTFARAVVRHEHRSRVRGLAPSATVEWCDPKRALVRVQTAEDTEALEAATDWQLTGLARFAEYGLQFFLAGEPAFWYAPDEELTPGEVVCHTLALDSGSRRVSYAMLLIEALDIDQETLTDTATWYDLETTVAAMYQALQEGSKTPTRSLSSFQVNQNLWRSKSSTV